MILVSVNQIVLVDQENLGAKKRPQTLIPRQVLGSLFLLNVLTLMATLSDEMLIHG